MNVAGFLFVLSNFNCVFVLLGNLNNNHLSLNFQNSISLNQNWHKATNRENNSFLIMEELGYKFVMNRNNLNERTLTLTRENRCHGGKKIGKKNIPTKKESLAILA